MDTQPSYILAPGTMVRIGKNLPNPPPGASPGDREKGKIAHVESVVNGTDGANYMLRVTPTTAGVYGFWEFDVVPKLSLSDRLKDMPEAITVSQLYPAEKKGGKKKVKETFFSDLLHEMGLSEHPKGQVLAQACWEQALEVEGKGAQGDPTVAGVIRVARRFAVMAA